MMNLLNHPYVSPLSQAFVGFLLVFFLICLYRWHFRGLPLKKLLLIGLALLVAEGLNQTIQVITGNYIYYVFR